jgi:hypothetical protein
MFEGLKKKFSNFVSSLTKKEENEIKAEVAAEKNRNMETGMQREKSPDITLATKIKGFEYQIPLFKRGIQEIT